MDGPCFKFIQINIFKGKYLDDLVKFLKDESPDFISMQEVTSGVLNEFEDKKINIFEKLKKDLGYSGFFYSGVKIIDHADASFGNAVFSKYPIFKTNAVILNKFRPITLSEFKNNIGGVWAKGHRNLVDVTIDFKNVKIHIISIHCRRVVPPVDDPEGLFQAELIIRHLRSLGDEYFIMGGDFNMPPITKFIKNISAYANNLMLDPKIEQTLNKNVHHLGENGLLVDYIFTSKHFRKISLKVPQITVSDHLPVIAELSF